MLSSAGPCIAECLGLPIYNRLNRGLIEALNKVVPISIRYPIFPTDVAAYRCHSIK
jgi:hypothetical protein